MKYKISQHLLILYSLAEPSDLMWLRLNIAIFALVAVLEMQYNYINCAIFYGIKLT